MVAVTRNQLYSNGEVDPSFGICGKAIEKVLSGSPGGSDHGPTDKANSIKNRKFKKASKMGYRTGRACHKVPTKNIDKGLKLWKLFADSSSNKGGLGAELILKNPDGVEFTYALRFEFKALNNEAKYEALLAGLRIADSMGVRGIEAFLDSKLVENQMIDLYQAKEDAMQRYLSKSKDLITCFETFSITQVLRIQNKQADALSKMASVSFAHLTKKVLVEILLCKSIEVVEIMAIVEKTSNTWITPIKEYFENGTLPEERRKARQLKARVGRDKGNAVRVLLTDNTRGARIIIRACQECQNANPPPTNNPPVLPTALRAQVVQELNELQAISTYIDSRLENINQFFNSFTQQHNEIDVDDIELDNESVDTPLVSPFLDSDDDSDDGEVLNELEEYGSFTYITDFVVLEEIGEFILGDMAEVVMGKPFRRVTKLEYDCAKGLMSFTRIFDNYTFQMPRTIPRFKSWGHVSWSKIPPILVLSQRDLTNGFRNAYEKNKFMYKNYLNLGPEYQVNESMKEWLIRGHVSLHEVM
ncbi:reverse transcriptase domain-containing protein [Tanacetum coccineum]